jgi:predicted Zn-dependent protease
MNRMNWKIRVAVLVIALLIAGWQYFAAPQFVNPTSGRTERLGLSPEEESSLGLQSYNQVLSQSQVVDTGPAVDQATRVAKRLVAVAGKDAPTFSWKVSVLDDPQVNAFCLPGGEICVYTGIIPVAESDAGLATVLGHEMAHATSHHGAERVLRENALNTAMLGVQGSLSDLDYQQRRTLMGLLGAGAQVGVSLPFSREQESEADAIGLIYMAKAGYDPHEAIAFWKRMAARGAGQTSSLLSDHPLDEKRIADLEAELPKAMEAYQAATGAPEAGAR